MDDVSCDGTESRIQDCQHTNLHNCRHAEDVGVVCELNGPNGPNGTIGTGGHEGGHVGSGRIEIFT
jgi:hypothetical protein